MSSDQPDLEADYIVIGVGAAGALIASRLSEDGRNSVIAIEAGENRSQDEMIRDSLFAGLEFGLEENALPVYLYSQIPVRNGSLVTAEENPNTTTPVGCNNIIVPGFNGAEESESPEKVGIYTTGRVLGGGTSINGEIYARGTVYDKWAAIAGNNWSNSSIYKRLCELENYNGICSSSHCKNGPVNIRQAPAHLPTMTIKFLEALKKGLGVETIENDDYNNLDTPIGSFGSWQLFQYPNGTRASSDVSFLSEEILNSGANADEANDGLLKVLFKATATKIIWSVDKHEKTCFSKDKRAKNNKCNCKSTAIGVTVLHNGSCRNLYATKKVILCAGVFSAEILQRSGVGPSKLLNCLNIPIIYDNYNVGRHLKNHLFVPILFSTNNNDEGLPDDDLESLYTGGAFLKPLIEDDDATLRGYQLIGGSPAPGTFLILLIYLQPHSEGIVQINSTDPLKISLVDNNYLGNRLDVKAFVAALREYILPLSEAFEEIDSDYQLISPTKEIIEDDNEVENFVKNNYDHTHHFVGTNRMGNSKDNSVVNKNGEVFGVNNLIVADASISPVINDGNTTAPAYAIAATIADILLKNE